jgi:uncharacterized protein
MRSDIRAAAELGSIWRYPVKSMMGEEVESSYVTERGLLGDRYYALVDQSTGKVISAKNPRRWPNLFACSATFLEPPDIHAEGLPPVRITLNDGTTVTSLEDEVDSVLSRAMGAKVSLQSKPPASFNIEEYWPDVENLSHRETVTDEVMARGTFFDGEVVHLLTTASLERLRREYPQGDFEACRFRPNLVVTPASGAEGFVENSWIGSMMAIGREVRLYIMRPTSRCVMTTLPQGNLPKDIGILKTAVRANGANVGVYATVARGGTIHKGDEVRIEAPE